MFIFPEAVSRQVFQYPTNRENRIAAQILRFVGGNEQRYAISSALKSWRVQPTLVPDDVAGQIVAFYELVDGPANPFQFPDPWDGTIYPTCFFGQNTFQATALGQNRNRIRFEFSQGRFDS